MNIVFNNKNGDCSYTVTGIEYGMLRDTKTTYVNGCYGKTADGRNNPTRLFKCKRTGRPVISLMGKMYAVNTEDDQHFKKEIMDKAEIK